MESSDTPAHSFMTRSDQGSIETVWLPNGC